VDLTLGIYIILITCHKFSSLVQKGVNKLPIPNQRLVELLQEHKEVFSDLLAEIFEDIALQKNLK
jgi:hypothetical protein